jgi:2-polyprenyl-3-methyl-5-hydroxy-6-metoxy-1,4-benzoquinol methylase
MLQWKGKVLKDSFGNTISGEWPNLIDSNNNKLEIDENGILGRKIENTISYEFHQKHTKGAFLRKFEKQKYHQINWETPYYKKIFDKYLANVDPTEKIAIDFGCGDGRFTEYLLLKGFQKIVCVDFDYKLLVSLSEFAKENSYEDNLLLIHSAIEDLQLVQGSFDLILSIRVLYYLNEKYEEGIKLFYDLLKQGGQLITSDPDMEGFILRTMIFDSLAYSLDSFEKRRFKEVQKDTNMWFRMFDEKEIAQIFSESGFIIEERHGISMFHNLLRVLQLRGMISEQEIEQNEKRIISMFNYFDENGRLFKDLVWNLRKP